MELTLLDKKQETKNVWSFYFTPPPPVLWTAGQFMVYQLPHEKQDVRGKMRFFTISSAPFENQIVITTKIDAKSGSSFKKALLELKKGETIQAKGPDGNFVIDSLKSNYVFIAGGIGITPFRSILAQMNHESKTAPPSKPLATHGNNQESKITLIYSNKDEDVVFKDELDEISKSLPGLKIKYLTGERIDRNTIKENVPDYQNCIFYISGPNSMVDSMMELLKELGVLEKDIRQDYFHGYDN